MARFRYLGGIAEIERATGVPKQTVNNWAANRYVGTPRRKRSKIAFPAPLRVLGMGRVWDLRQVRRWCERYGYAWQEDES